MAGFSWRRLQTVRDGLEKLFAPDIQRRLIADEELHIIFCLSMIDRSGPARVGPARIGCDSYGHPQIRHALELQDKAEMAGAPAPFDR